MKTVTIKVTGYGSIYRVLPIADEVRFDIDNDYMEMIDEGILDENEMREIPVILSGVEVYADDELIEKKGKYINRKDYYSDRISNPSFAYRCNEEIELTNTFDIDLEDGEEFDPMKLQLVKTNYELEFIPYGILTNMIVYNGEEISGNDDPAEDVTSYPPSPETYMIDYDLPYC